MTRIKRFPYDLLFSQYTCYRLTASMPIARPVLKYGRLKGTYINAKTVNAKKCQRQVPM